LQLAATNVFVGGQFCGRVEDVTRNGEWHTVKCSRALYGKNIRLVTTKNNYLQISGIEALTADPEILTYNYPANT
jgi:hypothetical protein